MPLENRPDALLLDFGGVVFETAKRRTGRAEVAALLQRHLARAGHRLDLDVLGTSIDAGLAALKDWKNAAGRRREPVELTHREIWEDFLASDLPGPVRATLAGSAGLLLERMTPLISAHTVRPGVPELLELAAARGIRVGIVSNAHAGRSHRSLIREHDLERLVDVQVYSDEVGIRKPHPGIVELAAQALGTTADRCWFVGDTLDRDVVAGRRAGVGAVVVTRGRHTDHPPYPVTAEPDAVFDSPAGLVPVLAAARATVPAPTESRPRAGTALLLDHGGVLVTTVADHAARAAFARELAGRLRRAGHRIADDRMVDALHDGLTEHRRGKATSGPVVEEITPVRFWCDLVGGRLDPGVRAWLRAEAAALSHAYYAVKSRAELRPGVPELLARCRERGVPVAVVSNTICGRAVRERLQTLGVADLIGVHAYSDEVGRRKPDAALVAAALRGLDTDPAACWFVGDKPGRDVVAARAAGIGTTVVVRGGSLGDEQLAVELAGRRPDHVLDSITQLPPLLFGSTPVARPA